MPAADGSWTALLWVGTAAYLASEMAANGAEKFGGFVDIAEELEVFPRVICNGVWLPSITTSFILAPLFFWMPISCLMWFFKCVCTNVLSIKMRIQPYNNWYHCKLVWVCGYLDVEVRVDVSAFCACHTGFAKVVHVVFE